MSAMYKTTKISQEHCPNELNELIKKYTSRKIRLLAIIKYELVPDGVVWYKAYMSDEASYLILSETCEITMKAHIGINDIYNLMKNSLKFRTLIKNALEKLN